MKQHPVLIVVAAIVFVQLCGSSLGQAQSLSLDVKPTSSGGTTKSGNDLDVSRTRRNESFSSTRQRGSGVGLEAEVRNLGRTNGNAKVEWYFFGKSVKGGDPFIFDEGSEPVSIDPASRKIVKIESAELSTKIEKSLKIKRGYRYPDGSGTRDSTSGSVKKSGSKVFGWIVRLVADNKVLQARASTPSLESIATDATVLKATLRKRPGQD